MQDPYADLTTLYKKQAGDDNQIRELIHESLLDKCGLDDDFNPKEISLKCFEELAFFVANLDRRILKNVVMTTFYGKGSKGHKNFLISELYKLQCISNLKSWEKSNQKLDQNLSLLDFNSNSIIFEKQNYSKIKIWISVLSFKSFRQIDANLKLEFLDKSNPLKKKRNNSVLNSLQPINYEKDGLFKEDFSNIEQIGEKIQKLQEEKTKAQENQVDLQKLKIFLENSKTSLTLKQLNLCFIIKSDFFWGPYIYQLILLEISELEYKKKVSLKELVNVLNVLQHRFENKNGRTNNQKFFILEKNKSIIENNKNSFSSETRFHGTDLKTIKKRKKVLLTLKIP